MNVKKKFISTNLQHNEPALFHNCKRDAGSLILLLILTFHVTWHCSAGPGEWPVTWAPLLWMAASFYASVCLMVLWNEICFVLVLTHSNGPLLCFFCQFVSMWRELIKLAYITCMQQRSNKCLQLHCLMVGLQIHVVTVKFTIN